MTLALTDSTVRYHLERLAQPVARRLVRPVDDAEIERARPRARTREEVSRLLQEGFTRAEISRRLSISKATVSYHARKLGHDTDARCSRRYDWSVVQAYYDEGHSVQDCVDAFGFSTASWYNAAQRGAIVPRPSETPIERLCTTGVERNGVHLRNRLVRANLKDERCERCGVDSWQGAPLGLELHHVNGDRLDNRLENLQLLCPNCHSQTDNFAGRKPRPGRPRGQAAA